MRASAEVVVVGGGIVGLSLAYNLARLGVTDVVVLEQGYLASGASGRNGGGIRQQWSTEWNIRLMQESVAICRRFAQEIGVNVWFRKGGYLFLARTAEEVARLERNVALQNRCGVPTRMLEPAEALAVVPELDLSGFVAACFNPSDGVLFPWPFLWGYAQQAVRLGAEVRTHTRVVGLERAAGGWTVRTPAGELAARRVVIACGAWSPEVAALAGVRLPTHPVRHEILVTEPLKPFLEPMVSVLATGLYFSQSMRGEIIGGITLHPEPRTLDMGSHLAFLEAMARALTGLVPRLAEVKVLRQWAGPYDVTPDGNPVLGEAPGAPGLHLCCGFMGHGFMMAPVVGKIYAEWLAGGPPHDVIGRCGLARFEGGAIEKEDFIIG